MPRISTIALALAAGGALLPFPARAGAKQPVTLYSFMGGTDGGNPVAGLATDGKLLYGTTPNIAGANCYPNCGTVFSLDPTTGAKTILHTFKGHGDGSDPHAGLLLYVHKGTFNYVHKGALYGTTASGGPYGQGTVFKIDVATQTVKTLHSFSGGADGATPLVTLIQQGDTLYGTTFAGGAGPCGASGCGTVFQIDPKSGAEAPIYTFQGGTDGQAPLSPLVYANGVFYGTTSQGGGMGSCTNGCGTAFQVTAATRTETILHPFQGGSDAANPQGALFYNGNGLFFGVSASGGGDKECVVYVNGLPEYELCGAVFNVAPATLDELVITAFNGANGGFPQGGILGTNATTGYGAAPFYGTLGYGTLFSINLNTGAQTILYNFTNGTDGATPVGDLLSVGKVLYGTTSSGGAGGYGTVFMLKP